MDPEEKELLKRLLSKVENLEKEIKDIKKERTNSPQDISKVLKLPPMPKTNDKLARIIVQKAREKLIREAIEGRKANPQARVTSQEARIQEIRENFDLGEVALFALKKGFIKKGKPSDKEENKAGLVVIKEE